MTAFEQALGDIGAVADNLGYGIAEVTPDSIELIARQAPSVRVRIDGPVSGDFLRQRLIKVEHRSGGGTTPEYDALTYRGLGRR